MSELQKFHTRAVANEGIELPLEYPDGTLSPHKLRVRGVDSDAFRIAETDSKRRVMEAAQLFAKDPELQSKMRRDERHRLLAALVASWTFDEPCTIENVIAFLAEAPQIADQLDRVATRRSLFFKKGSVSSTPEQGQSSS